MPCDLEDELARVEVLIKEGDRRIRRQRDIIVELEGRGSDAALAEQVLGSFEDVQRVQLAKREQLLSQWHRSVQRKSSPALHP